jgi:hypothetical protein
LRNTLNVHKKIYIINKNVVMLRLFFLLAVSARGFSLRILLFWLYCSIPPISTLSPSLTIPSVYWSGIHPMYIMD